LNHKIEFEKASPAESAARAAPLSARSYSPVLQLQQEAGNQAVQQLFRSGFIQAKLAISSPGEPEEREADQVADTIMRSHAGAPGSAPCSCSHDGGMCEECQQKQSQPTIHRSAFAAPAPDQVPRIVSDLLRSPGDPLDSATRAFFEPRFGRDLSEVRIHTGPEAAASSRSINAQAYTAGSHIVFDSHQYSPENNRGLLAHELAHVVQQSEGPSAGSHEGGLRPIHGDRSPTIRRSPGPKDDKPKPLRIQDEPKDEDLWRGRVDAAVRKMFDLSGTGLTAGNVKFMEEQKFGKQFSAPDLRDQLIYIFWANGGDISSVPGKILASNANTGGFLNPTPPDPRTNMALVRDIVRDGLKDGFFWYRFLTDGLKKITPQELVTLYTWGLTEMSGPRSSHKIKLQIVDHSTPVHVLVHETCHFYVSQPFFKAINARKDGSELIGGAMISKVLIEGFAEFFAREVMDANAADLGPKFGEFYPLEFKQAKLLADSLGEQTVRDAYFKADAGANKKLMAAIDRSKVTNPDLLIP
jgi:hypothetical protein